MNMQFVCYRLRFPHGVHVAAEGFGEESVSQIIASDTLFSAVCMAAAKLYGQEGVEPLLKAGAVQLSSAFPFMGEEYFFPRPLSFFPEVPETQYELFKRAKKVQYLSQRVFERVLQGDTLEIKKDQIRGPFWFAEKPPEQAIMVTQVRPRVALDRVTQASQIYHFAEVYFDREAGLFFLAKFRDNEVQQRFETALHLLADEGIGADRTVGKGLFRWEKRTLTLRVPGTPDHVVLLSLYNPKAEEARQLNPVQSYYAFITRRGWVTMPGAMTLRRRAVRFFAEGSVLAFTEAMLPEGRLVETLSPRDVPDLPHPIWRNGQAIALPIQIS